MGNGEWGVGSGEWRVESGESTFAKASEDEISFGG